MIVTCQKCNLPYDDAYRWTICPHAPLEASAPDGGNYCMKHDLFYCFICKEEQAAGGSAAGSGK